MIYVLWYFSEVIVFHSQIDVMMLTSHYYTCCMTKDCKIKVIIGAINVKSKSMRKLSYNEE